MGYPTTGKERTEYWTRQVEYGLKRVKPFFDAAAVLIKQYEGMAAIDREAIQETSKVNALASRVRANLIFGWIEQSIANMLDRNPTFVASPLLPESAEGATKVSAISNYWYRELGQLHQDERCLLDAFLCPYAVKKLGWTVDVDTAVYELRTEPEFDFGDQIEADLLALLAGHQTSVTVEQNHAEHLRVKKQLLSTLEERANDDNPPDVGPDVIALIKDNIVQHKQLQNRISPDAHVGVQFDAPYGQRWAPNDFVVDPYAQDGVNDARWIAFRWRKPLVDVLANPDYDVSSIDRDKIGRPADAPTIDGLSEDDDFAMVVGWEIWARNFPVSEKKRRNLLITIAEGFDRPLQYEDEWPYDTIQGYPVELLTFQSSVHTWYCKPTLVMAGSDNIQALANEILDSYLNVIRKQKNILFYDPDAIDNDTMEGMIDAPDMSMFPIKGLAQSNGHIIQPLQFGNVPQEKITMLNQILGLFDRAAGTPQPNRMDRPDTATQSNIEDRRTTAREARRGNLLGEFQLRTAEKFWQMTVQYKPKRVYLVDPDIAEFISLDDKTAEGMYHFRIDIGSQASSIALERKQWSDLLNLFAGMTGLFQQLYQVPPNIAKLAERLLKRGYNEQRPEEILPMLTQEGGPQTQPIPDQAAVQQMLQGSPAQPPTEGPSVTGPPAEVEAENRVGAALPRQFQQPMPSDALTTANAGV